MDELIRRSIGRPLSLKPQLGFDPRWIARATRYEIGADNLIHAMRILETNSIMQIPRD